MWSFSNNDIPQPIDRSQIYPVSPKNQGYLAGETQHISSKSSPFDFWYMWILVIALAIGLCFGLISWFNQTNLESHGVSVGARVVNQRVATGRNSVSYYLTYRFTTPDSDGSAYTSAMSVDHDTYKTHPIGSLITIIYFAI